MAYKTENNPAKRLYICGVAVHPLLIFLYFYDRITAERKKQTGKMGVHRKVVLWKEKQGAL